MNRTTIPSPFTLILIASLGLPFITAPTEANVGEAYGFGSRSAAVAGAGAAAWGSGAFASYSNPAALGAMGERKLLLDWAFLAMEPNFKPIDNIVVENSYVSDKATPRSGSASTAYQTTVGQTIAIAYQIAPNLRHLGIGITAHLPFNHLAYLDSGEVWIPEYVLYRARTQRPQVELGAGFEPWDDLYFGAGVHMGFNLTNQAKVFLQTSQNRASTMKQSASMKPKFAPYLGLLWVPGTHNPSRLSEDGPPGNFSLGFVFRFPLASSYDSTVMTATGIFTGYNAFDVNFNATASALYDPMAIELGSAWQYSHSGRLLLQLEYQAWGKFDPPMLSIRTTSGLGVSTQTNPTYAYKDVWIPRIGHELDLGGWELRAGYGYRPSIFASLPNGPGNYLDPPKHMISAGAGLKFDTFLGLESPCKMDLHASYHQLESQQITKTAGNEAGVATDSKVGAPGYVAGGRVYGGGLSLSFAF